MSTDTSLKYSKIHKGFSAFCALSRQKYAYLPYPESDFIFAIVGEDFGLL
ncbi:MAG: FtsW/RodA/SpoVE family cell cycle protein, partial [Clostridia bacterium]|nr:FtsW/RodA/SpoVE family cell cycle protein [Clostridia bacterium]